MKKAILVLVLSLYGTAYATGASDNCNGSGSCSGGGTTTNQGGTAYGGQGGTGGASSAIANANGGAGGNAVANGGSSTAIGIGGSSSVDVRSSNSNSNSNKVESSNVQGQIQGQGQKQSTSNANNSTNTSNVNVEGDNFEAKRIPVNTAFAPSIAPTANCALSVSGGVSFVGFSGSFGKAYIDQNCANLEKIRSVSQVLGDKETATAMMCLDEAYAKARLNIGKPCPVEQE